MPSVRVSREIHRSAVPGIRLRKVKLIRTPESLVDLLELKTTVRHPVLVFNKETRNKTISEIIKNIKYVNSKILEALDIQDQSEFISSKFTNILPVIYAFLIFCIHHNSVNLIIKHRFVSLCFPLFVMYKF